MRVGDTIYLDHQATTPVDPAVQNVLSRYFGAEFGNPHSVEHAIGWAASEVVERAASDVAQLVGVDPDEVVFTSGATEANNLALLGLVRIARKTGRNKVLVSSIEHECVLSAARVLRDDHEMTVSKVLVDDYGEVDLQDLEDKLDERVLCVSIMSVNNEIGSLQDLQQIAKIVSEHGALLHSDAAQAPCALDISELGHWVDLISLSSHKMYGPMGVGALYVQRDLQQELSPMIHGGGQQRGLRSGTVPVPLCAGMAAAAQLAGSTDAVDERKRVASLRDLFVRELLEADVPLTENGPPPGRRHPGNANIRFHGVDAQDLLAVLQPRLAASTGSACSSGVEEPSHVLRSIGLSPSAARECIRFSFGRFTTEEDAHQAVGILLEALAVI